MLTAILLAILRIKLFTIVSELLQSNIYNAMAYHTFLLMVPLFTLFIYSGVLCSTAYTLSLVYWEYQSNSFIQNNQQVQNKKNKNVCQIQLMIFLFLFLLFCKYSMFLNHIVTFGAKFCNAPDNPVPEHEEVESNEEPQHSSYIRHQGEGGVGLYLLQNLDLLAGKYWTYACVLMRILHNHGVFCQLR